MKLNLLQRLGLFFYDRRENTYLFWAVIVIFGFFSYTTLIQRQGFPSVDVPITIVSGSYFVDDAAKVDQDVTRPASRIVNSLAEVESVTALAGDSFFTMQIEFKEDFTSKAGTSLVRQKLENSPELPEGVQWGFKPVDAARLAEQSDLLVSIYSTDGADIKGLEAEAGTLAGLLAERDGVAKATVLKQLESGVNPATGQTTTRQRSFDRLVIRENGISEAHTVVTVGVSGEAGKDTLELSADIESFLEELSQLEEFAGIEMRISADLAEGIETQISGLQQSLLLGLAAVALVSLILISWRASLTGVLSMITVLAMTIGVLYLSGNTLNTVTLFALILSLGLIVDDATIMVEAIDAAKRASRSKRKIVAVAIKRIARASTAGTFTTMLAFAPMLFVSGILGEFIRILPVTIIISLAVSLLLSLTLVPFLGGRIILRGKPGSGKGSPVAKIEEFIGKGLAGLLLIGKRSRLKGSLVGIGAVLISLIFVVVSFAFFQKLKFDIFPATKDSNIIGVSFRFPAADGLAPAQTAVDDANRLITDTLGDNLRRISYQSSAGAASALATIDLVRFQDRNVTSVQLVEKLQKELEGFDGAAVEIGQLDAGPPEDALPFRVQLTSEDRQKALTLAEDIRSFLQGREVERANGRKARVTSTEIAMPSQIVRIDGNQTVEVQAGFDADDTSALVVAAQDEVERAFDAERVRNYGLEPDALDFDFGAESGNQESFTSMLYAFPVLLLAMYLLMALQFRSMLQPLLIFIAVPYSFFGVAVGLYLTDNPLSFFVMIGFFALIGIVVNNTILLTDFANQAVDAGSGRIDAIAEALRARIRPLLATSLTTVVALTPLALNDPFWESISFTLIFGVLSSTFLVLIAFPYLYLAGEVMRLFGHRLWLRQLPAPVQYPMDIPIVPLRLLVYIKRAVFRRKG